MIHTNQFCINSSGALCFTFKFTPCILNTQDFDLPAHVREHSDTACSAPQTPCTRVHLNIALYFIYAILPCLIFTGNNGFQSPVLQLVVHINSRLEGLELVSSVQVNTSHKEYSHNRLHIQTFFLSGVLTATSGWKDTKAPKWLNCLNWELHRIRYAS